MCVCHNTDVTFVAPWCAVHLTDLSSASGLLVVVEEPPAAGKDSEGYILSPMNPVGRPCGGSA